MTWNLPIVESELASKLRSLKVVIVSKDFNSASRPSLQLQKMIENGTGNHLRAFKLPPKAQFVLLNVKKAFKDTEHGRFFYTQVIWSNSDVYFYMEMPILSFIYYIRMTNVQFDIG
jgi:hypothetical protein